jgi:hypothetical protein
MFSTLRRWNLHIRGPLRVILCLRRTEESALISSATPGDALICRSTTLHKVRVLTVSVNEIRASSLIFFNHPSRSARRYIPCSQILSHRNCTCYTGRTSSYKQSFQIFIRRCAARDVTSRCYKLTLQHLSRSRGVHGHKDAAKTQFSRVHPCKVCIPFAFLSTGAIGMH